MVEQEDPTGKKATAADARAERLAQALRDNLKKRKAQGKKRKTADQTDRTESR